MGSVVFWEILGNLSEAFHPHMESFYSILDVVHVIFFIYLCICLFQKLSIFICFIKLYTGSCCSSSGENDMIIVVDDLWHLHRSLCRKNNVEGVMFNWLEKWQCATFLIIVNITKGIANPLAEHSLVFIVYWMFFSFISTYLFLFSLSAVCWSVLVLVLCKPLCCIKGQLLSCKILLQ